MLAPVRKASVHGMRSFLCRVSAAILVGSVAVGCATGGDASIDVEDAGSSGSDTGSGDDAARPTNDSGMAPIDAAAPVDASDDVNAMNDAGNPAIDAFVLPQDGGADQDAAPQVNCDTSTQAKQQKYLAEYLIAANQTPQPLCSNGCTASQCCFQVLCVAQ